MKGALVWLVMIGDVHPEQCTPAHVSPKRSRGWASQPPSRDSIPPLASANLTQNQTQTSFGAVGVGTYRGANYFRGLFFWPAKIGGGEFWYCSLEMKEKFGIRPLVVAS